MTEVVSPTADNSFKQRQFGFDDIQGSPVAGDPVLDENKLAVFAANLLEWSDISPFVDVDKDIITRVVKQLNQPLEKDRLIMRQDTISVLSHIISPSCG